VNDIKQKYNLPDTAAYDEFMEKKVVNFSQIDPKFYETSHLKTLNGKM
jgi:hypothetical protein